LKEFEELGMSAVALDVTNAESVAACAKEVAAITGNKLDILVNNAYALLFSLRICVSNGIRLVPPSEC
jgi:NAD(P)-dependent dehydrogenase (short-subunit alcohol dehydrogenase family)